MLPHLNPERFITFSLIIMDKESNKISYKDSQWLQ